MPHVYEGTKEQYYMDGYLQDNLDIAKKIIKKDWDMIFAIDGAEGSGKSVLTQQIAKYCDPTFNIDRIVFTPKSLRLAIIESKPYQAIIYDEAYTGLSSRATMSLINRTLVSMLAEIRQKNLFVYVVMPCFFDLDKYVALWRSRVLIHVYTGKNFQRGFFTFFNSDRKKALYMNGKKFYCYSKPKANFHGRFPNHYTVDEKEYKKKKRDSLIDREKKATDAAKKKEIEALMFERLMEMDAPHNLKIQLMGIAPATYFRKHKQWQDHQEIDV